MIQFDEHIFQMGWNHQPDKFARPEVLQLNGSVNHFKLSPFRPPKEVTIAELPRIRERPKNNTPQSSPKDMFLVTEILENPPPPTLHFFSANIPNKYILEKETPV